MTTTFATLEDLEQRHPSELITLAADETTGIRDDVRIGHALDDASAEVRGILKARYTMADLTRVDDDTSALLKLFAIDIALYRIALAFSRSNERIEERYKAVIKRLQAIADGKAGLSFEGSNIDAAGNGDGGTVISPNEVIVDAPERHFTRNKMRGL
jgi:phage gp36-like protein